MSHEEKTLRKNYVYQGKILSLRCDDALLEDGNPCKREIVEHSGGACALYADEQGIYFVRQYRYAYGETLLELPAGKLNAGEDPQAAAARELEEETGIKAARLSLLFEIYPSPGYTNERIYIYRAHGGKHGALKPDDGEFLDVVKLTFEEVKSAIQSGEIKDAKTLIALQAYFAEK